MAFAFIDFIFGVYLGSLRMMVVKSGAEGYRFSEVENRQDFRQDWSDGKLFAYQNRCDSLGLFQRWSSELIIPFSIPCRP